MNRFVTCALAALAVLSLATVGVAAGVSVGEKAPDFKGLPTTDGKKISLSDYADAKAVVVTFTCNNCPVAVGYQDRFVEFTKQYKDKGVAFVVQGASRAQQKTLVPGGTKVFEKNPGDTYFRTGGHYHRLGKLNYRVRDGNGCFLSDKVTGKRRRGPVDPSAPKMVACIGSWSSRFSVSCDQPKGCSNDS